MTDEDNAEEEVPSVELGDDPPVEGAPVARVASRLTWPVEKSEVIRKEGATVVRTPDGPRSIEEILGESDATYFARRQDFLAAIRAVIGTGPVPSAE